MGASRVVRIEAQRLHDSWWEGSSHAELLFRGEILWKGAQEVGQGVEVELSGETCVSESSVLGYGGGLLDYETK